MTTKHIEEIVMYIEEIVMYIVELEIYIFEIEIYIEETPMCISMASMSSVRTVRWVVIFIKYWKLIFINFMLVAKNSTGVVIR